MELRLIFQKRMEEEKAMIVKEEEEEELIDRASCRDLLVDLSRARGRKKKKRRSIIWS